MGNLKLLDCTLRDGGRVIGCNFGTDKIHNIIDDLQNASIDVIEIGFIRSNQTYREGSTFFTDFEQIKKYVNNPRSEIVVFVDYGMYDIDAIPEWSVENPVRGIRVGFTKGNFENVLADMMVIKEKGYRLYVQAVDTLAYSDDELVKIIHQINQLDPYAFGIVDTYGAMYKDDVIHYYNLYDKNLKPQIAIDFHSHNNYQLSFSLAQEIIQLASKNKTRTLIVDATLYGMGKVAGNLNTELIVEYLNKKMGTNYALDVVFDCIDENIMEIYKECFWGYSSNSLLSGIHRAHPNNVIYLTEKFKLDTNDINNILSMIDVKKRRTYDYDNIERCYIAYNASKQDDSDTLKMLKDNVSGKEVLLIAPGSSISREAFRIREYILKNKPIVISVNFAYEESFTDYAFFAHPKRYKHYRNDSKLPVILSSNVKKKLGNEYVVNYDELVERGCRNFDNAMIMLLRLLSNMNVGSLKIAGFDGFKTRENNFASYEMDNLHKENNYEKTNIEISIMFSKIRQEYRNKNIEITFLTESMFDI